MTEVDHELPSGSGIIVIPVKKRGKVTKATKLRTATEKKTTTKNNPVQSELLKTLFKGLSDTLVSTLNQNKEQSQRPDSMDSRLADMEFSENESVADEQVIDTNYNIFSDEENEPQVVASDEEFDYELPKIFEDV